jgi:hydrogen peroxide-dependent heme synthase
MNETTYTLYPVFRANEALRRLTGAELDDAAQEIENLFKAWEREDRVRVRGTYSTVGFRADADVMWWLVAGAAEEAQRAYAELRRTRAGRLLDPRWNFMGVVRPAEFTPDHAPAFVRGEPPKTVLCVYPFVRTPEWYLLPGEERSRLLSEHGIMGREFPDVLANTTSAFGLGDWEWILAFEADDAGRLVECIRRLRDAGARRYTKEEVPFVTGIRKEVRAALADAV